MNDETKEYGDRHLATHLYEAGMYEDLLRLANAKQQRIAELERQNELLRAALSAIANDFMTPEEMYAQHGPSGLDYEEFLEMAYENMQATAQAAIDGAALETAVSEEDKR